MQGESFITVLKMERSGLARHSLKTGRQWNVLGMEGESFVTVLKIERLGRAR